MDGVTHIIFIILIGMLGGTAVTMFLPKSNRNNVGDVKCTHLAIVDPDDGKTRIVLGSTDDGGLIQVFDKNEKCKIEVDVSEISPMIRLLNGDGNSPVCLSFNEDGGAVVISGNGGKSMVTLGILENSGVVGVHGKDGNSHASLSTNEHGGYVGVSGKDENGSVTLGIREDGGIVNVRGKDENSLVGLAMNGTWRGLSCRG